MQNTPFSPAPGRPDSHFLVAQPQSRRTASAALVLLATDGTERSDGAVRVASARAEAMGARLEILTIVAAESLPEMAYSDETNESTQQNDARRRVEVQIERALGRFRALSITVLDGTTAFAIACLATQRRATLLVVGLGRHRVKDRLFGDETALHLARIARVPVLAVPATCVNVPRCAVVAVDFSDLSLRAAQVAVEAVGDRGEVTLVHVMPNPPEGAPSPTPDDPNERWAAAQLDALRAKLVIPVGTDVHGVCLRGRPAAVLLVYAEAIGADLLVAGTHGRGLLARAIVGSVTTDLLRGATCPVLTVPRDPLPALSPALARSLISRIATR